VEYKNYNFAKKTSMNYTVERQGNLAILRLNEPKLDERFSSELKELFLSLIKLDGINQMLLDLKNVKHVDSGVISAFLMAHRLLRDDPEAVFVLTGLSDSVKRVLNIAHLTTVFDIFDTVEEAVAAIKESISLESREKEPVALESSPDDDRLEKEWKEESSLIRLTDEDDWDEEEEWDEEEDWEEEDWDEEDWEEEEEDWDEDDWDEDEEWEEESSLRSEIVVRLVDEEDWDEDEDEEWDEEEDWDEDDWEEEDWDEDDWDEDEEWEEESSLRSKVVVRLADEDDWDEEEDWEEDDWEEEDWDEDDWDEEEEWEDELS
jgi:anti-anti-sigma factor